MGQVEVIARALSDIRDGSSASGGSRDAEEVRAFLQARLASFGLLVGVIFSLFLIWRGVMVPIESLIDGWPLDLKPILGLVGHTTLFLGVWRICRGRPRSMRTLRLLDLGAISLGAAGLAMMPFSIPYVVRPDYIEILAMTYILMVRAIYIPSTWQRTARIAALVAPMLLTSLFFVHYRGHDPAFYTALAPARGGAHEAPLDWAIRWTVIGAIWWLAAGVLAAATSRLFYGLRQQVRDARKLGQYTLLEQLGAGGMGVVYRASHALLRRPTAVKLLPPEKFGEESLARFEREVQLTAMLSHPNTVRIFDYGRTPDRVFYYAMEFLDGATLDRVVKLGGPMPAARVIHILEQVAGALAEAHGVGLIHRDIKPANIMLVTQGGVPDVAKVLDFGLVKEITGAATGDETTMAALSTGERISGTPQYMSPEAISTPTEVDARTDLYAVGAVGYFLLTGAEVFKGRSILEICGYHLHSQPVPPSQRVDVERAQPIPADLEALILRCLAKSPAARPASARALREALLACADHGRWTEEEARAWWEGHGAALRDAGAKPAGAAAAASLATIDVVRREAETVVARNVRSR